MCDLLEEDGAGGRETAGRHVPNIVTDIPNSVRTDGDSN